MGDSSETDRAASQPVDRPEKSPRTIHQTAQEPPPGRKTPNAQGGSPQAARVDRVSRDGRVVEARKTPRADRPTLPGSLFRAP